MNFTKPVMTVHLSIWLVGAIIINIPAFELRMGVFFGGDYSLLLSSLYGFPINVIIFYGIAVSLQGFQKKSWATILKTQAALFMLMCTLEILLDSALFYWFYDGLSAEWMYEIVMGSILLNFMFIVIPAWVFGIIDAGLKPTETTVDSKLSIKDGATNHILDNSELYFIKSEGNYVLYQTKKGKIMVRGSLKSVEKELPKEFVRCHKSYVVNSAIIEKKTYSECTIGEFNIPIGRTYQKNM